MKLQSGLFVALFAVLAFWVGQAVFTEGRGQEMKMPSPQDMKEMMEKMTAVGRPGENHEYLEPFVGEWDLEIKMWWGGPGTPAATSKGSSSVRWVLDGRFIMEDMKWEMEMPDPSNPFNMQKVECKGLGLSGYDNYRNMYVASWADNQSTHLLTMKGARDPSGKKFTYYGEMDEPMLNVAGRTVKYVNEIVDHDKHVFHIFDLHAGDGYKVLEFTYTRK